MDGISKRTVERAYREGNRASERSATAEGEGTAPEEARDPPALSQAACDPAAHCRGRQAVLPPNRGPPCRRHRRRADGRRRRIAEDRQPTRERAAAREAPAEVKRRGKRSRRASRGFARSISATSATCCAAADDGRLPPANIPYLEHVLLDERWLPKPSEVAEQVHFTYAQQQANHLYTVPAVDKTEEELAALRRAKEARRKMRADARRGVNTRRLPGGVATSDRKRKPWVAAALAGALGIDAKPTWHRVRPGYQHTWHRVRPHILTLRERTHLVPHEQTAPQLGQHGNGLSARPRHTNGNRQADEGPSAKKKSTLSSYGHGPVPPHRGGASKPK